MSLSSNFVLPVIAALGLGATVANAQSLTRIENHGFYGATVTIEEGVRVFRPLPSTGHMIINPGGRTPVNLTISESVHHYVGANGGGGGNTSVSSTGGAAGGLPLGLAYGSRGWAKSKGYLHSAHSGGGGRPVGTALKVRAPVARHGTHGGHH